MSYSYLLRLSRSAIKRIILIHRSLLNASAKHAKHQSDTAAFIHEQAEATASVAYVSLRAARQHAKAVEAAVQAELKTLPEYK